MRLCGKFNVSQKVFIECGNGKLEHWARILGAALFCTYLTGICGNEAW